MDTGKSDNLDSEDGIVSDILTRETIHSEEAIPKVNEARKFQKIIDSFFHSILIANKMARTRGGLARRRNNFNNRRFAAAKEIANTRRRNNRFKIKFFYHKVRM